MQEDINFFQHGAIITIPPDFNRQYLEELHKREKVFIYEDGKVGLKDFSGYIGDTLYIPQKLEKLLQLENSDEYKKLFTNLFSMIISSFKEEILFQLFPTKFGLKQSSSRPSLIFQLNTILQYRDELILAFDRISKYPHRRLVDEMEYRRFDEVSYIDDTILLDNIQNPQNWFNKSPRTPIKVLQYSNFESVDTIENRFVKNFIFELVKILDRLVKYIDNIPVQKILIQGLIGEIENFQQDFTLNEIGELKLIPYNSQVLLKRSGYRELFALYNRLHHSFQPSFFDNIENAISLKDISSLWEYYVMSKLIHQFGDIENSMYETNLKVRNEVYDRSYIKFKNGVILKYQHIIYSYSDIPFRPDFYIEYKDKKIVIDAKFRVLETNRTEIMKNMHYYRDSLNLDLALAVVLGTQQLGELYRLDGQKTIINNFDSILENIGVGYLSLNLKELLK